MSYSKWIGGGLGWAFGGPIGGLVGFALGALMDGIRGDREGPTGQGSARRVQGHRPGTTTQGDLALSLVVLTAALMKVDGRASRAELDLARAFFRKHFGEPQSRQLLLVLREVLKQDIDLHGVCDQVRRHMHHAARLQLLHYLIGLAHADGSVSRAEVDLVRRIAGLLNVSDKDLGSLSAMFGRTDLDHAYRILEVDPAASDEEVKKAYRRMAMKHHPDKVGSMGEEVQRAAAERFKKVQDAWERIRSTRGLP
ncbi:MAG: TerB family tellurite resistance protein [Flavobacteriales bacterium]|nr:DnaJ-like protein DjlA [Flavobacteriales bacterium]MCC6575781.1 TerB family tellurite resistance protein [Flavobacteriales bacterium]